MATAYATAPRHPRYDSRREESDFRVVARHRVRMVRLLHLRNAGGHSGHAVLLRRRRHGGLHLHAAGLRRRLCRAPVRRPGVRPDRRSGRPQIHLPGHHRLHGPGHLPHRPSALLRQCRHHRARHPDRAPAGAGPGAGRRIWRRGDLRRRTCAARQTRLLHLMDSNHRDARPVHGAAARARHPHLPGRTDLRRLGLAYSVPAVGHPAGGFDLDPPAARRIAGVPR